MYKLHENYYLRKCFFEREQFPTQTQMKKIMGVSLAQVYFKMMKPQLKALAGLEPPLKGGGSDWYVPPADLLEGQAILKPVKKKYLNMLGYNGIENYGFKFVEAYLRTVKERKAKALKENDNSWKESVKEQCLVQWQESKKNAIQENTNKICQAFEEFTNMYSSAFNEMETVLVDAAKEEVSIIKTRTEKAMSTKYAILKKKQAELLLFEHNKKLALETEKLKKSFLEKIKKSRQETKDQLHLLNLKKHVAIEKIRHFLECQNLACQAYVALKEREKCEKELTFKDEKHKKKIRHIIHKIDARNQEIKRLNEKIERQNELNELWKKKVCHLVKSFQEFVSYSLKEAPEQAEFFLNMEKLLTLQMSEAIKSPNVGSVIYDEFPEMPCLIPKSKPYILIRDAGKKPVFDEKFCPDKATTWETQIPVIIINDRCIYSACDNMERFADQISDYIAGQMPDGELFDDTHDYDKDIPVTHTTSKQKLEIKLESSLLQLLQGEFPNLKDVRTECCLCKTPWCFCSPPKTSASALTSKSIGTEVASMSSGEKIDTVEAELKHIRQPKWESYLDYVKPTCDCAVTAKKHLMEHLPPYMRNMSKYQPANMPNYEPCNVQTIRHLVRKARNKKPKIVPEKVVSKTKDVATQYSDIEFETICDCMFKTVKSLMQESSDRNLINFSETESSYGIDKESFTAHRIDSLRQLVNNDLQLQEIFVRRDCATPSDDISLTKEEMRQMLKKT